LDEIDDPILDASLDEVLGGVKPPDLTEPIVRALEAGQIPPHVLHIAELLGPSAAPPPVVSEHETVALPSPRVVPIGKGPLRIGSIRKGRSAARHASHRIHIQWLAASISLCVVVAAGTYFLTRFAGPEQGRPIARHDAGPTGPRTPSISSAQKLRSEPRVPKSAPVTKPAPSEDVAIKDRAERSELPVESPKPAVDPSPEPPAPIADSRKRMPEREVIAAVDEQLRAGWTAAGVRPSGPATEREWCRRVFLALIGRIPTVAELESFQNDRASYKKAALVDRLLSSDEYREEFARHWSGWWTTVLVGRSGEAGPDRPVDRDGLQQYLRRTLAEHKPLNRMTYELLTATGSNQPGAADFNGATNFLMAHADSKGIQASAKTAQVFLGRQIQCMQCHNHPFYEGDAQQFWDLAAFFQQTRIERPTATDTAARLVDRDYVGESGDTAKAETYWETQTGVMKTAYPVFLDGTKASPSGLIEKVNRRKELAKLVTRSPMLSEALVNRVWEHFFGRAFTPQVDDMGPHANVSHPALMELLSEQLAAHSYDFRSLVRWIALSEAYGLSSKFAPSNQRDDLGSEDAPLFSRYYLRQMEPEQIYESLVAVGGLREHAGDVAKLDRSRSQWVGQLAISLKTDDCSECTLWDGSIPQTLLLMNGELTDQATQVAKNSFLKQVEQSDLPTPKKIQRLFLAAVARKPSAEEMRTANKLIAARNGQVGPALEDLWWALLNSSEFIMDR
jgi:hypothetical protein